MCPSLSRNALVAWQQTRTTPQQPSRPTPAGEADGGIEMQSACVQKQRSAARVNVHEHPAAVCIVGKSVCPAFVSRRLQQSLVPQTRGTRGGEPTERHVGSYLSAFFRLLGKSVCVLLAGGAREWETVECAAVRASLSACAL